MNRRSVSACLFVMVAAAVLAFILPTKNLTITPVLAASPASAACTFPSSPGTNSDELAWRLFVAVNCPTGNSAAPLTWETWPTQEQVFGLLPSETGQGMKAMGVAASASTQRFHASVLARANHPVGAAAKTLELAPSACNSPTTATNPYTGGSRQRVLCEEVRLNPAAATYVVQNNLYSASGQSAFVKAQKTFQFPLDAVEVKVDWEQNCADTTKSLHREKIAGVTYCMITMHIDSKLLPDWLWATWETTSQVENPARCYSIGCKDSFGFTPSVVPSGYDSLKVRNSQTMRVGLSALETNANLEPGMRNYIMDGSQTQFVGRDGKPTLLGNSVTEAELAGVPLNASSCITCHKTSVVNTAQQQNLGPLQMNMIGRPPAVPGYASRDFIWTFIIAKGYAPIP